MAGPPATLFAPPAHYTSVRQFGASGDGTTDDTTKIQAAVNSLPTSGAKPGGTIYFPPGTYIISAPITVPNGVRLLGSNPYTSTIKAAAGATLTSMVTNTAKDGTQEYIWVESLGIMGNRTNGSTVAAGILLEEVYVNSYIHNCVVSYCTGSGIIWRGIDHGTNPVTITNSWVNQCQKDAILIQGNATSVWIDNVFAEHFDDGYAGLKITTSGSTFSPAYPSGGNHISGFHTEFAGATSVGILLDNVSDTTIVGASFQGGGSTAGTLIKITGQNADPAGAVSPGAGAVKLTIIGAYSYVLTTLLDDQVRGITRPGPSLGFYTTDQSGESISALDYGAIGDGVHDDTAALQAALDAMAVAGGPATLLLPSNLTFKTTATLTIPYMQHKRIAGTGTIRTAKIKCATDNIPILQATTENTHSIALENISLEYTNFQTGQTSATALLFTVTGGGGSGFYSWDVRRLYVRNAYRGVGIAGTGSVPIWDMAFRDCYFSAIIDRVFNITSPTAIGMPPITIERCRVINTGTSAHQATTGPAFKSVAAELRISHLDIEGWKSKLFEISGSKAPVQIEHVHVEHHLTDAVGNTIMFDISDGPLLIRQVSMAAEISGASGTVRIFKVQSGGASLHAEGITLYIDNTIGRTVNFCEASGSAGAWLNRIENQSTGTVTVPPSDTLIVVPTAHAVRHARGGADRLTAQAGDYAPGRLGTTTLAAETMPRYVSGTALTPAAGIAYVNRLTLQPGAYTTATLCKAGVAGATIANAYLAIYDPDTNARLGVSADLSTPLGALAINTDGQFTLNTTITTEKDYYISLLIGSAGTMPTFFGAPVGASGLQFRTPTLAGRHNSGSLTAMPDPIVVANPAGGLLLLWLRYE